MIIIEQWKWFELQACGAHKPLKLTAVLGFNPNMMFLWRSCSPPLALHAAHATEKMFTRYSYCLPATLLTSNTCSPLCLRRNEGATAAGPLCLAVVNYGRRLVHLPASPDTMADVVERVSCSPTAPSEQCPFTGDLPQVGSTQIDDN